MTIKIYRRYSDYRVGNKLVKALDRGNSYYKEDCAAIKAVLDNTNLSNLPHTWGAAAFEARVERLKREVLAHQSWCRWKLDYYYKGSYCDI